MSGPPTIEHRTIPLRGINMHLAHTGHGPPLVLLHGWPEFWAIWEPVMARLADRFTMFAPDLHSFGETGRDPAGPPEPTVDAEAHADDLLALRDAFSPPSVGLVGHDVGAYVL